MESMNSNEIETGSGQQEEHVCTSSAYDSEQKKFYPSFEWVNVDYWAADLFTHLNESFV